MRVIWQGKPGDIKGIVLVPVEGGEKAWLEALHNELSLSTVVSCGYLNDEGVHHGYCIDFVTSGKTDVDPNHKPMG